MRTHLLGRLTIAGGDKALALEPEFDFYRITRVLKVDLDFECDFEERYPTLRLDLEYEANSRRYKLGLLFEDVRELTLPTMAPLLVLPELEIEDIRDRMMEGVRFEAISQFERAFRCLCGNISILFFEPA